jgi:hypothetical protein
MKASLKIYVILGILITTLILSCKKSEDNYPNKSIDINLIGVWKSSYSIRDLDNGITVFIDTLSFNSDNSGRWDTYRFSEPYYKNPFIYFTENNKIHLNFTKSGYEEVFIYEVRNDSLLITGSLTFIK